MLKRITGTDILNDISKSIEFEWIAALGNGGFASSTVTGCNTRRYHGLLVTARPGDPERMVLVSKLEESIIIDGSHYYLSTNRYTESYVHPRGYTHLREFSQNPFPRFVFTIEDVTVVKQIIPVRHSNTVVVRYEILNKGKRKIDFELYPLIACKNFHKIQKENREFSTEAHVEDHVLKIQPYADRPMIRIKAPGAAFNHLKNWYKNFQLEKEKHRGLDYIEDLYNPGYFRLEKSKDLKLDVVITCEDTVLENVDEVINKELERHQNLFAMSKTPDYDAEEKALVLAADMQIVRQPVPRDVPSRTTIVAGYHWFGDWGRDTFISLPGLTLETGRFEEAKEIFLAFAEHQKDGLIPNRFGDLGADPIYNTVDASLWFINAAYQYAVKTCDYDFIKENLYSTCEEIVKYYKEGTDFNIFMDNDHLVSAGSEGVQLTWMDAKVNDWVVTPRHGKPVEINALWYNGLKIMEHFSDKFGFGEKAAYFSDLADKVRESFNSKFWYERGGYLYDTLSNDVPDFSFRPNQIYSVSLPYPVLNEDKWLSVINQVYRKLYTPFGLRSLDPGNPRYRGHYAGGIRERDGAYHMGIAWGYLLGPFIEGFLKANGLSPAAVEQADVMLSLWLNDLLRNGLNTLAEIYDGDDPFTPRGCISQAWTIAEALRMKKLTGSLQEIKGMKLSN